MVFRMLVSRALARPQASKVLVRTIATRFQCYSTSSSRSTDAGVATAASDDASSSSSSNGELEMSSSNDGTQSRHRFRRVSHRRYENFAPVLYEWTHKLVSGELTLDSLMASERYAQVSKAICDTTRHSDKNILNLLKSLVIMNLDPETRLVQFLENELLIKLEHYPLYLLMTAYQIYSPATVAMSSPLRGQIVDSIYRNINNRLDAVEASLADLIQLIKNSRHFTPEILLKIEDQATRFLDSNDDISLDQLCYLLVLLSRYSRRNKPLIRAVVAKLLRYRSEDVYSMPPHLIHMISSLNRLNFPEVNLLEKCSDILINLDFLECVSDSPRRDFLVAISQFNFNYPKLINYYLQKLHEKPDLFKRQDLITLTITLARLNYHTEDFRETLTTQIIPKCSDQNEFISRYQYFNFIYSLALLRQAPAEHLKTICSKEFLTSLEHEEVENYLVRMRERNAKQQAALGITPEQNAEDGEEGADEPQVPEAQDIYQVMNLRRKYLNLSGLLLTEDGGKALERVFATAEERQAFEQFIGSLEFETMKRNKDLQVFRENIFKLIDNFAPIGKYMTVDRKLPYGFSIDAELLVDSEGQPQPLASDSPNLKRIALMCIGFNDTLLDSSSQLIGPKEVEMRILRSLGYIVIPVHQNIIPAGTTSLNRVKFLQNLIVSHQREAAN